MGGVPIGKSAVNGGTITCSSIGEGFDLSMDIQHKVVIVTGASEGIGEATAKLLAQHGAQVVLAARSADKLDALNEAITAQGGTAVSIPTDMRNRESVQALIDGAIQHFGRIDVLINNAGQAVGGSIEELDMDKFQQVIDLNIKGVLYAMQAVIPRMRPDGGLILNISSMVSKMALPGIGGYAATKYMLNGLSMTARAELEKDNIRVILVHPRRTATAFGQNGIGYRGTTAAPTAAPTTAPSLQAQSPNPSAAALNQVDTAEHVAGKILEAIQNEPAEQFMV